MAAPLTRSSKRGRGEKSDIFLTAGQPAVQSNSSSKVENRQNRRVFARLDAENDRKSSFKDVLGNPRRRIWQPFPLL
jgi:hypothetical protein